MPIFNRVKEIVRTIRFAASPRLYGRYSSGAGDGQEISLGSSLTINSSGVMSVSPNLEITSLLIEADGGNIYLSGQSPRFVMDGDDSEINVNGSIFAQEFSYAKNFVLWGNGTIFTTTFTGTQTANRAISFPDASGTVALRPVGPYANDAAASAGGVAVGFLYYTADGSVKRRMA